MVYNEGMRYPPLFVRPVGCSGRGQLQAGLRSQDVFTLRRCQILLASAAGQTPRQIAAALSCSTGTVHNALHAFATDGLRCLQEKSSRPHSARPVLGPDHEEARRLSRALWVSAVHAAERHPEIMK